MSTNVRSVTVRLDALVSKYVADMRMAGRETDKAFASAHASMASTNRELGVTHSRLGVVNSDLAMTNRRVLTLGQRLDPVKGSLAQLNAGGGSSSIPVLGNNSERTGNQIDRMSGRLRIFADLIAVFGPSLIPIAAVGIPALTGLAAQFGVAAVAGGTALIAFQGVGDTLKAVNAAALEPTTENLNKAREALARLSPEAAEFVRQIQEMRPAFTALRDAAASGLFPGLTAALDEAEGAFDRIERVLHAVGEAAGGLAEDFAEGLTGPRGQEFLSFLETEVPSALTELGHTVGNFTAGLAEMWMAFTPLNRDFSGWLLDASRGFDDWASGLSQTEGFREFVDYIRTNGPRVADAMGAIGNALLQIVEAAAPLGGPILKGIEAFADTIAAIADSELGTPIMVAVAAMSALSLATKAWAAVSKTSVGQFVAGQTTATAAIGRTKAALMGIGKGVSILAAIQAIQGLTEANDDLEAAVQRADEAMNSGSVKEMERALAGLRGELADATNIELFNFGTQLENLLNLDVAGLAKDGPLGQTIAGLVGLFGDGKDKADELEFELEQIGTGGRRGLEALLGPAAEVSGAFRDATGSALSFRDAVIQANNALSGRASFRDYEQALDDLSAKLKELGDTDLLTKGGKIDVKIPEGREVQALLDNIAGSALKVAENLKGADRVRYLARARRDFVDVAAQILGSRDAARKLATELGLLDKKKAKPTVDADTKPAKEKLSQAERDLKRWDSSKGEATATVNGQQALATLFGIKGALDSIKSKTVWVNVKRNDETSGMGPQLPEGGFAGGGFTGWRRPDEVAGVVHGREFVFSEPATTGNLPMLQSLHQELRRGRPAPVPVSPRSSARAYAAAAVGGGHTRIVERTVERLPRTIVLDAGELGQIVIDTTDARIGDYRAHDSARAGTVYGGVGSD